MARQTSVPLPKGKRNEKGQLLKPTRGHRPALWEAILGTLYAANARGIPKYFDYDYAAAIAYAGFAPESDVRVGRYDPYTGSGQLRGESHMRPRIGQTVWWVK